MCETKMCRGCPFNYTDEADIIQNYGCLPDKKDIIQLKENNADWKCHSKEHICMGLVEVYTGDNWMAKSNRKFLDVEKKEKFIPSKIMVDENSFRHFMLEPGEDIEQLVFSLIKK